MTDDELTEVVQEFRASVPQASEKTRQKIYDRATGGVDGGSHGRTRSWGPLLPSRTHARLIAAVGVAVVGVVAVVATGTFASSPARRTSEQAAPPAIGQSSPASMTVAFSRDVGGLSSIKVMLSPNVDQATIQLQVIHSNAPTLEGASANNAQVVYQTQVATTAPTQAMAGPSFWSGTLSPSDWSGGCQPGFYQITSLAIPPGTMFATATAKPGSEFDGSEWFSCTGPAPAGK